MPIHALLLTAGLGTRLRPLTSIRAKPAIPLAGEPIARRIVRWLVDQGVTQLVLNLHHLPHTIAAIIGDGSDLGATVRYSWEQPVVLGSAGGPRQALPILGVDTFFIVNGDTLTDLAVEALASAHAESGALVTLALVPNLEPARYGGVLLDAERRVTGFVPRGATAKGAFHFIGVQLVHRDAFSAVAAGTPVNSIGGTYDELIARTPGSIRGFVCDATFFDVGTVGDYWRTSTAFSDAPVHAIVWDDVTIAADAVLDECIVTDGVDVPAGSTYHRAILMRGDNSPLIAEPLTLT